MEGVDLSKESGAAGVVVNWIVNGLRMSPLPTPTWALSWLAGIIGLLTMGLFAWLTYGDIWGPRFVSVVMAGLSASGISTLVHEGGKTAKRMSDARERNKRKTSSGELFNEVQ